MWDERLIRQMLHDVSAGKRSVDDALVSLRGMPTVEDIGVAKLDHHRALRQGFTEVVYCASKTPDQVAAIVQRLAECHGRVLGTRATREHYEAALQKLPALQYHELGRCIWYEREPREKHYGVVVVSAGTADMPIAE